MRWIPRVAGVIEIGDSFSEGGAIGAAPDEYRAAVVDPSSWFPEDIFLANSAFTVRQGSIPEMDRECFGDADCEEAEVCFFQFERLLCLFLTQANRDLDFERVLAVGERQDGGDEFLGQQFATVRIEPRERGGHDRFVRSIVVSQPGFLAYSALSVV